MGTKENRIPDLPVDPVKANTSVHEIQEKFTLVEYDTTLDPAIKPRDDSAS